MTHRTRRRRVGADKIESEVVLELGGEIPREEIGSTLQFLS